MNPLWTRKRQSKGRYENLFLNAYQFVDDRIDGQTRGRVDIQFACDVFAMGDDSMYGDAKFVRYLFVA